MKNSCKVTKTGQKCINLTESHFKEIISELENAAQIITSQKSEIESLEVALSASRDEIELLQESDRTLKKEKKKLVMESQKISSTLSNEIETLKMELQHSQKQVEVWKGRTNESKASLRKFLESTIMDSGEDSINNGTYIESYESTIMNLKNQLDERLLRIEQLEMNYQNVNLERDELSNEVAGLKAKNKANEYELRELREKQRKEENERKRFSMREEKLSHEIDSLCKKYNAEIDELQKKNILLNDEIWELNRIIKSNNNSIKELQDQNSNNKKYYEYYIAGKKVEDFITSKISDFESSVRIQLTALTNLVHKFEKSRMLQRNHHSMKRQSNPSVHTRGITTTGVQSFAPVIIDDSQKTDTSEMEEINPGRRNQENHLSNLRLFENDDSLINNNSITIATTASSGMITASNSQCVSNNNSNSPFILSQLHAKPVDLNSLQGSNTAQQNDFINNENFPCQELTENIPPNYSELVKETMKVLTQASKDHQAILEKIQYLSDNIDDAQVINQTQYCQNSNKVIQNEDIFDNNGGAAYYSIGKEEIYVNRKQPTEDDSCSESSIISFLSEL
ncbi:uncharacterized protein ELE39_003628 [Cryptosporidium sp. chipmunk genotype I]|uniref:uncharacterized protein n=1 Tax=Cryptosporidium sp. chipmunk genotype I TaxID=1280935 RepID=UPI003519F34C|nr:hypothetical protein ELE39_003628 [Cryptosporidium sp. chipmunk genotype I]